jgi:hypothetical protein
MAVESEKSGMKFVSLPVIFVAAFIHPVLSHAQLDSSYELLLGNSPSPLMKPQKPPMSQKAPVKKRKVAGETQSTNVQPAAPAETSSTVSEKKAIPQDRPMPVKMQPAEAEPSISQQAQSIFSADPEKVLDFYQSQFEESDSHRNKIEISFAPAYVTNDSSSNYSYRDYRSVFTGVSLGANVWLTPAVGIGGNFMFSLGADTSGDAVSNTRSAARYEFLDIGLKFRQFFGFMQTSKSVEFDVLYSDYKFSVNADDIYRAKLKTAGLGLKMTLRLPSSPDVAWLVGGSFYPRLQHTESKAGIDIGSGNNTENVRMGVQLGSEVKLSRDAQVFYEISAMSEKNMFDDSAKSVDPATGVTPKSVSVTDTFYVFSLGYRWGN